MKEQRYPIAIAAVLITTLFVGAPDPAFAADPPVTYYVAQSGTAAGTPGDGTSCAAPDYVELPAGDDDAAITAAIGVATAGDTIHLCAGTYDIGSPLTITGHALTFEGAGAGNTILDGGTDTQIMTSDSALTIRDLTFMRGHAISGGAIYTEGEAEVSSSRFIDNNAVFNGGAITGEVSITVTSSIFSFNTAAGAGAIWSTGGVNIKDSTFTENTATGTAGAVLATTASIKGGRFTGNAAQYAGAVHVYETATIDRSFFTRNVASHYAGAFLAPTAVIRFSEFSLNRASWYAGAVVLYEVEARDLAQMRRNRFTRNVADRAGAVNLERCGTTPTLVEGRRVERENSFVANRATELRRTANIQLTMDDCD